MSFLTTGLETIAFTIVSFLTNTGEVTLTIALSFLTRGLETIALTMVSFLTATGTFTLVIVSFLPTSIVALTNSTLEGCFDMLLALYTV